MAHRITQRIGSQESKAKPVAHSIKKQSQLAQATSPMSTIGQTRNHS